MITGFIVKKLGMTNRFLESGKNTAVTRLLAMPLKVTQIKDVSKDGYVAVQVGYGSRKHANQSVTAKLKKIKIDLIPKGFVEFRTTADELPAIGTDITIDSIFSPGDRINASGTTKGRGFAGVIKRHGFHRQPVSGGQSDRVRAPGAIGAQTPGKVLKGKKMPGHYGNVTQTISHLRVIEVNKENNEIVVIGSVPGHINSWVVINKTK